LFLASSGESLDIVKLLVEHGADVNEGNINKRTPLHEAAPNSIAIINYLIDKSANLYTRDSDGDVPFHKAAGLAKVENMKIFLVRGMDVNIRNKYGETPLHLSSKFINVQAIEFLIASGADIKAKDGLGQTPLHSACSEIENLEVVKYLIKKGADVNAVDNGKVTPLHLAALKGHAQVVEFLVKSGADVNCLMDNGFTPLLLTLMYWSSYEDRFSIVKMLVSNGARVDIKTTGEFEYFHGPTIPPGLSAIDMANKIEDKELLEYLKKHSVPALEKRK
jgi:ankyrin repeat protein